MTPASFAIYAVVILFAMIGDPYDIPAWLTVLPPVMVKFAGLFNPLAHLLANPKINAAIRKMLELSYDPTQLQSEPRESVQLTTVGVGPTPRPVGNDTARCNK